MRQLLTKELPPLLGCKESVIKFARMCGSIKAAWPGKPGWAGDLWSEQQVLGLAVARALKARGVAQDHAWSVYEFISGMTVEQLETHFAEGRSVMIVVGFVAAAQLTSRDALAVAVADNAEALKAAGLTPWGIDVGIVWAKLRDRLKAMDAAAAKPADEPTTAAARASRPTRGRSKGRRAKRR